MDQASGDVRRPRRAHAGGVNMWQPCIGDLVNYQGKLYEVGFVYPQRGAETAYHTRYQTGGRLRLQDPKTHSGNVNVGADEVELVEVWTWK
jgi:hypothetical protein